MDTSMLDEHARPRGLFLDAAVVEALDEMASWTPSEDQTAALRVLVDALREPGRYQLTGAAGCGKSTVMKALLRRLAPSWEILLIAPTWRAANRLRAVTGQTTSSVHRAIYGAPKQMRRCPGCEAFSEALMEAEEKLVKETVDGVEVETLKGIYTCGHCKATHTDVTRCEQKLVFEPLQREPGLCPSLVVVDESSMLDPQVVADLEDALLDGRTRVLYVGDPNQLPPVEKAKKGEVQDPCGLLRPTAALHHVHRQGASSPILRLAHDLKTVPEVLKAGPDDWPFPRSGDACLQIVSRAALSAPAWWAAQHRHAGNDCALITFSNATRAKLNALVRELSGAANAARAASSHLIPGDRLLARGNSTGVYNGEIWTVLSFDRVPPGSALLDADSRAMQGGKPRRYEHDVILGRQPVGVWRLRLSLVESPAVTVEQLLVLPLGAHGPMLESDLIQGGVASETARQQIRETARAWQQEYRTMIEGRSSEYQRWREDCYSRRSAEKRLLAAFEAGDARAARRAVARIESLSGASRKRVDEAASALRALVEQLDDGVEGLGDAAAAHFAAFESRFDSAAEHDDVESFLVDAYGALRPSQVGTFDFGEALTCYAMQGSQAAHVGVVIDSPFWGAWRNDRIGALKWAYTSATRATECLSIFQIAKDAR